MPKSPTACYSIWMEKLIWSAPEYEEKERSSDWFWALGIIVFTSAAASIIYGNYFFATLIVLSGVLLGYVATRKPHMVTYELNETGFLSGANLYPYENIKAFWVQKAAALPEELRPLLFLKTERVFMPIMTVPIENIMADSIHSYLLEHNVVEEEMKEPVTEKIMEALGF